MRRRKARPFSVMVSKKDAEAFPAYPVFSDTISPELANALSTSIASKSPERALQRASVQIAAPMSPVTPLSKANLKKRLASELILLSETLNELERERLEEAELHESLIQSVQELSHKKQKVVESLGDEHISIEKEYRKVKSEYLKIKRERDALKQQLDEHVTVAWKKHVHTVQASDWFSEYERGFY
jgi:Rad3-related DNA helicase